MGDTAVDFFLKTLQQLITSSNLGVIIDEKHQLQSLEEEIKYLRGFLKITEKKRNEHSEVMKLVTQIRDVVSEAENIVELFVALAFKADHASDYLRKYYQDQLSLDLESVKKEIKTLTAEVKQIYDNNMYDMNGATVKKLKHSSSGSGGSLGGSNTSKLGEEIVVVGFEKEKRSLMEQLHNSGKDGPLEIISIIGAPGGGKTTLAKEVYQAPLTSHAYEIRAWVVVSQDYDKTTKRDMLISILKSAQDYDKTTERDMLISILKSAPQEKPEDYAKSNEDMLGEKVHNCLKGRKYLIVMDDIWSIEAWTDIQRSFPKECKGSKVLLTSRQLVVQHDSNCHVHRLAPLQEKDSWELLQKKVFGMKCPPEFVDIGKQIAKKCEGLPLAIVTIAGILATEDKTPDVWVEVASHLSSIIAKKQEGCMEILDLSYNHLPLHLKACFLYIGAHPEDFEIPVRELIWLWIAEGFIQQSEGGKSLEDIAEDYLTGLIDRSLVMVTKKSDAFGGIKACRIHDLLRELCLKKAEEDNFFVKIYEDDPSSPSITCKHRRLFIGHQFFHKFSSRPHARNLRSFLCLSLPNSWGLSLEQELSFFVRNFKLLRVLNFITARSRGEIGRGDLVHLRYLALHLSNRKIPFCAPICFLYLSNLETLNLKVRSMEKISLPGDIVKMVKLRHLYTKEGIFQYHVSHEEEEGYMLDSLHTLYQICPCQLCRRLLVRTPNLRTLGVFGEASKPLDLGFLECLEKLKFTEKLTLGLTPPTRGLKLPPTVTRLTLENTRLKWEELSIFQTLPSLEVLKLLYMACEGPVWNTSKLEEGFSQLKYLRLYDLDIKEWNASADQFPRLEILVIEYCEKLKGIPIDFADLSELRKIKVVLSRESAAESAWEIQEERRNTKGDEIEIIANLNDGEQIPLLEKKFGRMAPRDSDPGFAPGFAHFLRDEHLVNWFPN